MTLLDSAAARTDLAPSGTLRAAINFDNTILASRDAASGEPSGVSVELARELARRLSLAIEYVPYYAAGKVVEGLKANAWDVCFLAIDPIRAQLISFTAPYVVIEGAYLVIDSSPIRDNAEVDRPGVRVAVSTGSAYDLFLSRELKHASIVRAPTAKDVVGMFVAQNLEVAAGVRPMLEADVRENPRLRMLPGRFMAINQAMGTPRGREAGAKYLAAFIEDMKASGFVADALARSRVVGARVAPAGGG
jgi:polar amino acid transport system substrate-binding protein